MIKEKNIPNKWTLEAYIEHTRIIDANNELLAIERDRRYSEGNELRAMALKIKETADNDAKILEREASTYRENRNDVLREQSLQQQGVYVTRNDLQEAISEISKEIKLIANDMSLRNGQDKGMQITTSKMFGIVAVVGVIMSFINSFISNFVI